MVSFRAAGEGDRDFVFAVAKEALAPYVTEIWGWDEEDQRRRSDDWFDSQAVEIICRQGEPVGCFALGRHDDHLYVARIALLARWQRRGIGTATLRRVIAEADERRLPVRLTVLESNPARRLYERLSFAVVEDRHPKLVMERPAA